MNDELGSSERLDRSWQRNAVAWTATVRERRIESRRVATDRAILDAVQRRSPSRVLDAGCGEGWLCRELGGSGISCTGVDGAPDLIDAAQREDPGGHYHVLRYADFERLAAVVGPRRFDAAVFNFSLLHADIRPILDAAGAVLRPGGAMLIQTVHPWTASTGTEYVDGWRNEDFGWSELPFPESMPWYFRTLESWIRTLSESGFYIDSITEPLHPDSGTPLSLLMTALRRA